MLISLDIKDNKAKVFLEFLRSLDFVSVNELELSEDAQIKIMHERLEEYNSNSASASELTEVLKELKTKYGF